MKNEIRRAINTNLAGLCTTEKHVQEMMRQIRAERQVKKKLSIGLVMAIVIMLLAAAALAVGVMSGVKFWRWDHLGSPLDMVAIDDQVFFHTEDSLYQWNPSEEAATELGSRNQTLKAGIEPVCSSLFVQDGKLMLLGSPGRLWRYEAGEWMLERDYQGTPLAAFADKYFSLFEQDGFLFLLRTEPDTAINGLYRLNLADGSVKQLALGEVMEICEYKNGAFLAIVMDAEQQNEKLIAVGTLSGEPVETLATLHTLALDGLTYDASRDHIYAMVDGALSIWNGQNWQAIRKASIPGLSHSFCVADGKYLAANHEGIQSIPLDEVEDQLQKTLTIRGYRNIAYNLDHNYQQAHPELSLSRQIEAHLCAEEVREAILAGDKTDLFHLHVDANWIQLLQSELLQALDSQVIEAFTENAEDVFQELVYADGKVCAVLSDITITVWESLATDTPDTFSVLLRDGKELVWSAQNEWTQGDYVNRILRQHIAESGGTFDTPAFRSTMETLKHSRSQEEHSPAANTSTVFNLSNLFSNRRSIAPLRVDANSPKRYPVRLHLYVLNPNSENKEEAIAFLEYVASVADAQQHALLAPHTAQPVLLPFAQQMMEEVKMEREQLLKQGIEFSEQELERRLEEIGNIPGHWQVTQERLAWYREQIFPNLDFRLHPLLAGHNETLVQMETALQAYLEDDISLDALIAMLDWLAE